MPPPQGKTPTQALFFREGDVFRLDVRDLPGQADLAWASSPCQDFSLAGPRAGLNLILAVDGDVSVSIRQDSPLKATLRAKRNIRSANDRGRDPVSV